ncbi:hypothetical protein P7K49_035876 [Saguinus oedipus]|uniref:Uncharacterized protein n=1 Tax=Saguinus oedipus TaxID=9490 RepID=A0ABQ9TP78_SAGOE|nr:hypothetical protein P7K49_035876 [Saguinus oedipus]
MESLKGKGPIESQYAKGKMSLNNLDSNGGPLQGGQQRANYLTGWECRSQTFEIENKRARDDSGIQGPGSPDSLQCPRIKLTLRAAGPE